MAKTRVKQGWVGAAEVKKKGLTSLGDDGSGSNDDDGPVELGLEVVHNLLVHLVESGD